MCYYHRYYDFCQVTHLWHALVELVALSKHKTIHVAQLSLIYPSDLSHRNSLGSLLNTLGPIWAFSLNRLNQVELFVLAETEDLKTTS